MKAIVVSCPNCGARLRVSGDSHEVTCEYCETHARVQRRTQFFERTLPPPQHGPKALAIQKHTKAFVWVIVLTTVLPCLLVPVFIWLATRSAASATQNLTQTIQKDLQRQMGDAIRSTGGGGGGGMQVTGPDAPDWQGTDAVLLVDVDGNGSKEIVGRTRRVQRGDAIRVIALDGATGKPLWESEPIGTYTDTYQGHLAVVGDALVFGSPRGEVRALALATGKPRWSVKIDERVKSFCDGGDGIVLVVGNDDVARPLKLADGSATTSELPPPPPARRGRRASPCTPVPSDTDDAAPFDTNRHALGQPHGITVDKVYAGPLGRVVAGQRAGGTRVGMLMLLDAANKPAWKIVVATDPLAALTQAPEPVAVGASEVCAAYYEDSIAKPKRIACFAGGDGKRLWDVPQGTDNTLSGMSIHNRALLVWSSGSIELRALDGGKQLWVLGD